MHTERELATHARLSGIFIFITDKMVFSLWLLGARAYSIIDCLLPIAGHRVIDSLISALRHPHTHTNTHRGNHGPHTPQSPHTHTPLLRTLDDSLPRGDQRKKSILKVRLRVQNIRRSESRTAAGQHRQAVLASNLNQICNQRQAQGLEESRRAACF